MNLSSLKNQIPIKVSGFVTAVLLGSAYFTGPASAAQLTLDQGRFYSTSYDNGGMGGGRGFGFHADETINMSALAIDLSVPVAESAATYRFQVFASTDGHSAGSQLASTDFSLSATSGYQDISFNFTFAQNSFYVINFRRADGAHLGLLGTHYSWEDIGTFVPHDYGILTILEGFEGATPNSGNPLMPHMRMTIVPEPTTATLALLSVGVLALSRRQARH